MWTKKLSRRFDGLKEVLECWQILQTFESSKLGHITSTNTHVHVIISSDNVSNSARKSADATSCRRTVRKLAAKPAPAAHFRYTCVLPISAIIRAVQRVLTNVQLSQRNRATFQFLDMSFCTKKPQKVVEFQFYMYRHRLCA